MSNSAVKLASVFFVVVASSTASFARGGGWTAAVGGVRPNVGAAVGTAQSQMTDPSGMANAKEGSSAAAAEHKCPDGSAV